MTRKKPPKLRKPSEMRPEEPDEHMKCACCERTLPTWALQAQVCERCRIAGWLVPPFQRR